MNEKKIYIWQLAAFLASHNMRMSGGELADHLNRNEFLTGYGTEYRGGRGVYRLIEATWKWVNDELQLPEEARKYSSSRLLRQMVPMLTKQMMNYNCKSDSSKINS